MRRMFLYIPPPATFLEAEILHECYCCDKSVLGGIVCGGCMMLEAAEYADEYIGDE